MSIHTGGHGTAATLSESEKPYNAGERCTAWTFPTIIEDLLFENAHVRRIL
jgi:hypothetical protein